LAVAFLALAFLAEVFFAGVSAMQGTFPGGRQSSPRTSAMPVSGMSTHSGRLFIS
jgi:hypothetical protein